jgi:hypothetical protein
MGFPFLGESMKDCEFQRTNGACRPTKQLCLPPDQLPFIVDVGDHNILLYGFLLTLDF